MSRFDFNLIRVLSITSKGLGNIHLSGSRKKRTISHKKGLKSRYENSSYVHFHTLFLTILRNICQLQK